MDSTITIMMNQKQQQQQQARWIIVQISGIDD